MKHREPPARTRDNDSPLREFLARGIKIDTPLHGFVGYQIYAADGQRLAAGALLPDTARAIAAQLVSAAAEAETHRRPA